MRETASIALALVRARDTLVVDSPRARWLELPKKPWPLEKFEITSERFRRMDSILRLPGSN